MKSCVFCEMVKGNIKAHIIWEDSKHLAFLSNRPNILGFTVVITKSHYPSYCFDLDDNVLSELTLAAKKVGKLLDAKLPNVGRTALIMEGYGIDHAHVKLFPMSGTGNLKKWKPIISHEERFFEKYEGFVSSHEGPLWDEIRLADLAGKIKK